MTNAQVIGVLLAVLLFRPALCLVVPRTKKAPVPEEATAAESETASAA